MRSLVTTDPSLHLSNSVTATAVNSDKRTLLSNHLPIRVGLVLASLPTMGTALGLLI